MRRKLLLGVALALAFAVPASARQGQGPVSGSTTGGAGGACVSTDKQYLSQSQNGAVPEGTSEVATTTPGTGGQFVCSLMQAKCTGTYTKLACAVTVGLAGTQGECGIFDSTGATRVASSGAVSTAVGLTISGTGLTPYVLTSGTMYLVCFADSATTTVTYRAPNTQSAFHNTYTNVTFSGGTGTAQLAQFNDNCTANVTPYSCCTGADTGTCIGMAAVTGVPGVAAASVMGPTVMAGP